MQGTGAAEGEEREVARVVAAGQRHHADRAGHVGVGEPDRGRGGVFRREPERRRDRVGKDRPQAPQRHRFLDREERCRVEPPEQKVRVGDGRARAAAAVADRPGIGAGALRSDLQHPGLVDGDDRAAAGPDGAHVDHRHMHRQPVGEGELGGHLGDAAADERDVGRGAAHVVGDRVLDLCLRQRRRGRHDAGGGAGHHGLGGFARHHRRRHRAAVAVHDEEIAFKAARRELAPETADVAVEDRLHGGVHRGGCAALVFAELRKQRVPERDVGVRPGALRDLGGAALVRRVGIGMQKMDDERLAPGGKKRFDALLDLGLVERRQDLAAGAHALADFEAQLARDQRLEGAGEAVRLRPGAAAELEGIAEAPGGDEPDAGGLAFEHRVRRRRRAVDDEVDVGGRHAGGFERIDDALGLVAGARRHFRETDRRAVRAGLMDQQIREGAADVDARHAPHPSEPRRLFVYE